MTPQERFWVKVDKSAGPDGCWMWTASLAGKYGSLSIGGRSTYAHRLSMEWHLGRPLAPGEQVDHRCFQKLCVNPKHLRVATPAQNSHNREGLIATNTSGYTGVNWHKRAGKWMARVSTRGKTYYLGLYERAEDAAEAARLKRLEVFTFNDRDRVAP